MTDTGQVSYRLKRPWSDGRTHLFLSPVAFLRRLAGILPPPRRHLARYAGVFAPRASRRGSVVALAPALVAIALATATAAAAAGPSAPAPAGICRLAPAAPTQPSTVGRAPPASLSRGRPGMSLWRTTTHPLLHHRHRRRQGHPHHAWPSRHHPRLCPTKVKNRHLGQLGRDQPEVADRPAELLPLLGVLENVRIPRDALLGEIGRGHKIAFNTLNIGRIKLGVATIGGCKHALELSASRGSSRSSTAATPGARPSPATCWRPTPGGPTTSWPRPAGTSSATSATTRPCPATSRRSTSSASTGRPRSSPPAAASPLPLRARPGRGRRGIHGRCDEVQSTGVAIVLNPRR